MLNQLEQVGYSSSSSVIVAWKRRKYYRATQEGAAALESAKGKLRELAGEVLHDRSPRPRVRTSPGRGRS
jgi:DNA-binding PadR family transcriptional regulator